MDILEGLEVLKHITVADNRLFFTKPDYTSKMPLNAPDGLVIDFKKGRVKSVTIIHGVIEEFELYDGIEP